MKGRRVCGERRGGGDEGMWREKRRRRGRGRNYMESEEKEGMWREKRRGEGGYMERKGE